MGAGIGVSRSGTGRFSRIFPRRRRINKDAATARARVRARAPSELQNTAAGAAWQLSQVLDVIVARRRRLLASSFVDVSGAVRPTCLRDSAKVRGTPSASRTLETRGPISARQRFGMGRTASPRPSQPRLGGSNARFGLL